MMGKLYIHWLFVVCCICCGNIPVRGQSMDTERMVVMGNAEGPREPGEKGAVVINRDTLYTTVDDQGNFKMDVPGEFDFYKPQTGLFIYSVNGEGDHSPDKKVTRYFSLDADTVMIHIDRIQGTATVIGGYENAVDTEFITLDRGYHAVIKDEVASSRLELDSLGMEHHIRVLELIGKHNSSSTAYNRLFSLFRPTVYPLRDRIYAAIDSLDNDYFTIQELEVVENAFLSFVQKNANKLNDSLWPELEYTSHKDTDFSSLVSSFDYVLIDIWATWCGPCREQHPYINTLATQNVDNSRFGVVGIAIQCRQEDWEKYLADHSPTYFNYWLDAKQSQLLSEQIKITGLPRYVLLRTADNTLVEKFISFDKISETLKKYNLID